MPRFIEVSHVIEPGMIAYPGLPAPEMEIIVDHESSRERYQNKSEFLIASPHLCGNTGTYVDAPIHLYRDGTDLAGLPLDCVAHLPVRLFDARALGRAVGPELFAGQDLRGGRPCAFGGAASLRACSGLAELDGPRRPPE